MTSAEVIAELVRRHRAGTPMVIDHPSGGIRVIAEIYPTETGFVFADMGWNDPLQTGHPFHVITGRATSLGEGMVDIRLADGRNAQVFDINGTNESDPIWKEYVRWRDWIAADDGKNYRGAREYGLRHAQMLDRTARL